MMVLVAFVLVSLIGMAGLTIDVGRLLLASRTLQATADDAALAGAIVLPYSQSLQAATQYSAVAGAANARPMLNGATMMSGYPMIKCIASLQSQGYACNSPANGNAVQVREQVTVTLYFMRVFGKTQATLTATSTARTGLIDLGTAVSTYTITSAPNSQYLGTAVIAGSNANSGWTTATSSNGYSDPDIGWIMPPNGNGSYPNGAFTYTGTVFTNSASVTLGLFNADDDASVTLYDTTTGTNVQVGTTVTSQNCSNGNAGSWCNAPLGYSYTGLSRTHTYQMAVVVNNDGGGPSGLLLQGKGTGPAALYPNQ